jgi:hypothetical protein
MPGKRVFFVCKSKNCLESKRASTRCTISMMQSVNPSRHVEDELNQRKLCIFYSHPDIVRNSNTPHWVISEDKPGERTKMQRAKKDRDSFIVDHPEFLEVN